MSLETEVQALTVATTDLLEAVTTGMVDFDEAKVAAELAAAQSLTSANNSATSASQSAGSAAQALAIYSNTAAMQTAVSTAQAAASLAGGHAASASSVVQQDLSGINAAALHRSPNAVTAMFVYDTGRDSDGGSWTEKCQHTSWYNEPINGKWLGAQASEAAARAVSGAATGDYFQRTTDGLFYSLNATSGITQTFRGNKRDFPRLAGIVAEATNVTIYDLTEPGRPMWMRFNQVDSINSIFSIGGGYSYGFVTACEGRMYVANGVTLGNGYAFGWADFAQDAGYRFDYSRLNVYRGGLSDRNGTLGHVQIGSYSTALSGCSAIAHVVMPNAPVDPATGLRVPTLLLMGENTYVWTHNNVMRNLSVGSSTTGAITQSMVTVGKEDGTLYYATNPGSWDGVGAALTRTASQAPGFGIGNTRKHVPMGRSRLLRRSSVAARAQMARAHESDAARSLIATVADTFNTGHQTGDIRRTYLADVGAGSATGTVSDRSYKAASATITGTLVKSEVAAAAQLVAYSGFSAANYAQEPYHADLDFGTGEWTLNVWVNVPTNLSPLYSSFPKGPNLVPNGTFDTSSGWTLDGTSIADGVMTAISGNRRAFTFLNSASNPGAYQIVADVTGGSWLGFFSSGGGNTTIPVGTASTAYSINNNADGAQLWFATNSTGATIDNIFVYELLPLMIAHRAHSSGPRISLGLKASGHLTATVFDGTTTRTVTSTAAYNTATWLKARVNYTTDGTLALLVNGVQVAATRGNPLLTLNNSNAVLTIGNSFALDAPFPGSLALLKFSGTVPTAEQAAWMYEQEKHLFQAGAQCCLPDAGAIADLTYDGATDKWIAVSAANESEWSGLVRTSVTPVPAGSYTRAVAGGGVQLLARSTTSPGVDVTIPAYGLREELVKRAESAARLNAQTATYDFVGGFTANTTSGNTAILSIANLTYPTRIQGARVTGTGIPANATIADVSGTTGYMSAAATATGAAVQINLLDFALPTGLTATAVLVNGVIQREGPTAAYTRLFDGFREVIRFAVAPGNTAWVQIQTVRSAA